MVVTDQLISRAGGSVPARQKRQGGCEAGGRMYRLEWCGCGGSLCFRRFDSLEDAVLEGLRCRHSFNGVEIMDDDTGEPVEL